MLYRSSNKFPRSGRVGYLNPHKLTAMRKPLLLCLLAASLLSSVTNAQTKKTLAPDDYRKWQTLGVTDLSPNGEWVAHQITVQEDNDTLYLTNRNSNKSYKLEFASAPEFSRDNQWMLTASGYLLRRPKSCGRATSLSNTKWDY
jgi:hypothetical protein